MRDPNTVEFTFHVRTAHVDGAAFSTEMSVHTATHLADTQAGEPPSALGTIEMEKIVDLAIRRGSIGGAVFDRLSAEEGYRQKWKDALIDVLTDAAMQGLTRARVREAVAIFVERHLK